MLINHHSNAHTAVIKEQIKKEMRDKGEANVHGACVEKDRPTPSESYAGNEKKKKERKKTMLTQESEHRSKKKEDLSSVYLVCLVGRSLER